MCAGEVVALLQGQGVGSGLALALASVVLAPVLEELLFRGFLLPCLAAQIPLPAAVGPCSLLDALSYLCPCLPMHAVWEVMWALAWKAAVSHAQMPCCWVLLGVGPFHCFLPFPGWLVCVLRMAGAASNCNNACMVHQLLWFVTTDVVQAAAAAT